MACPEIGWPELRVHPRFLLQEDEVTVSHLWWQHRGGMAGPGPLPFGGGTAEQPALVMDAFGVLNFFANLIEDK